MKPKYPWFKHGLFSIFWQLPYECVARHPHSKLVWGSRIKYGIFLFPKAFWIHVWLPKWCKGRGYYISIGLWFFSIHRGY